MVEKALRENAKEDEEDAKNNESDIIDEADLSIEDLEKVNSALNLHTNIIYIKYIINAETQQNPTKPNENKLFPNFPNETKGSPKRPLCDVVSLHRENNERRVLSILGLCLINSRIVYWRIKVMRSLRW